MTDIRIISDHLHRMSMGLCFAALLIMTSVFKLSADPAAVTPPAPMISSLSLGPLDVIHIDMDGQADITKDYVVDSNGQIHLPYIGQVLVGGMSVNQAQFAITSKLSRYYQNVSLSVTRISIGEFGVTINGAVAKSGLISVRRGSRLNEVVQLAAPSASADLSHIRLARQATAASTSSASVIDLKYFLATGDLSQNPLLQDGDTLFVPTLASQLSQKINITALGAVAHPGPYEMPLGSTVFDALSVAGGLLPNADPKSVYVQSIGASDNVIVNITQASASPSSQMVNPPLKDGDRVVVPENQTFFSIIGAVHTPKEYPFRANLTLLDAFTLAGGYEANADLAHVKVTRSDVGGPKTIEINAKDPNNSAAFHLQSGDNVSVGVKSLPYRIDPLALLGIAVGIWGATR